MRYVKSEDGSASRDPVYIRLAESQLISVMNSLESVQGRCSRQSLEMVTAGPDLRHHIHIIRAALDHRESPETVFANQWIDTAKKQARRLEDEARLLVENAQLNIESMTLQVASFLSDDTPQHIDRDWRVNDNLSRGRRAQSARGGAPFARVIGMRTTHSHNQARYSN
jgi:hypothetical protein